ncbi:MAG: flagellin, partial [Candidatus Wallbacteria bacterium]|nr:flagellin [Candidatus Wallbacteria bacterium]
IDGGKMAAISYDPDQHSLEDIRDKINASDCGVKASTEKHLNSDLNQVYYSLNLESEVSGREIVFTDQDQTTKKMSAAPLPGVVTAEPFTSVANAAAFGGTSPGGVVIINNQEFELADYATIDGFMNAVKNNDSAGVGDIYYDSATQGFVIEASVGRSLEMEDNGAPGFFSAAGIQTRGNLMESLGVRNWTTGSLAVDPTAVLSSIPGIREGSITVNGEAFPMDVNTDSLSDIVDRINAADVGVKAFLHEVPAGSGSGQYTLMMRSEKPGAIELEQRGDHFFSALGMMDANTGTLAGFPSEISDPRKIQVFDAVINIRDHLMNGDVGKLGNEDLSALDGALEQILQYRAKMGARVNTMDTAQQKLAQVKTNTLNLLSTVEDVDIADTIMKMTLLQNVHQAALSTGSQIMYTSLVDFLR